MSKLQQSPLPLGGGGGGVTACGETSASGESKNLSTPSVRPLPLPAPPVSQASTKESVETVEGSTPGVRTIEGSPPKPQQPAARPSPVKASQNCCSTRTRMKPTLLDPSTPTVPSGHPQCTCAKPQILIHQCTWLHHLQLTFILILFSVPLTDLFLLMLLGKQLIILICSPMSKLWVATTEQNG